MRFCTGVEVSVQILVTIVSGVFEGAGVEFHTFPLTCVIVLKTLWHTVSACDFTWRDISVLCGWIWVKLSVNIYHVSGQCWEDFQDQRSKVTVMTRPSNLYGGSRHFDGVEASCLGCYEFCRTGAIDCLLSLICEMTRYVLNATLCYTHSLTSVTIGCHLVFLSRVGPTLADKERCRNVIPL